MTDRVREPIQVYLTPAERAELDQRSAELGVSRSEALRRGIQALSAPEVPNALRFLVPGGHLTPAANPTGIPPRGAPAASLAELLSELERERGDT